MSLDVYLDSEESLIPADAGPIIFIRDNGQTRRISREEWNHRFPGQEPVTFTPDETDRSPLYEANITHNLGAMADAVGIYRHLWEPGEIGITHARQLIVPLVDGLELLRADPDRWRALNPENGWGTYEGLVEFVEDYLIACRAYPSATVRVWR